MNDDFETTTQLPGFDQTVSALVIGASGGIGRALVQALAQMQCVGQVFATARSRDRVDDTEAKVEAMSADVTAPQSLESLASSIANRCQRLDLVIYAAGLLHDQARDIAPERQLKQLTSEALEASFAVNAFGVLHAARALQGLLPRKGRGVWANISARVGSIGDNRLGGWYSYRAAKAAQNMISRNLAIEWGHRNRAMTVLALHPGTTDTALSEPFQKNVPAHKLFSPERAAHQLLAVINAHDGRDRGQFYDWANEAVEW